MKNKTKDSIQTLKNLGKKSQSMLNKAGIYNRGDLLQLGAVNAFLKVKKYCSIQPSINLLYSMVGALTEKRWQKIAKEDKIRLLMELEDANELLKTDNDDLSNIILKTSQLDNMEMVLADYENKRDADSIIYLLNHYAMDEMGGGKALSDYSQENLIQSLKEIPDAISLIIYVHKQPVALLNAFEGFSTFQCKPLINIHDLMVHKDYRGLGLSQLLLNQLETLAVNAGCCKITLEVLGGNVVAQNIYLKHGFKPYQLSKTTGTALFLEKEL